MSSQMPASMPAPSGQRPTFMELRSLLRCPSCRRDALRFSSQDVVCDACTHGWPVLEGTIPYFAQDAVDADPALRREVECQNNAVRVYQNPRTLAHHWDQQTMPALTRLFRANSGLVLDLGCGVGYFAAHAPQYSVVGVDVSPVLLHEASGRAGLALGADARALPFEDGTFDLLYARGVLHHLVDPAAALLESFRVLKPGGEAVFHDPRAFQVLEFVKKRMRRKSDIFAETHTAFPRGPYRDMIESAGFRIDRFLDWDPVGLLLLSLGDELSLGRLTNAAALTRTLMWSDRVFDACCRWLPPWREFGLILAVHAVKP